MTGRRAAAGIVLVLAAVIVIMIGYWNLPSAHTCADINQVQQQLTGQPGTCRSSPGPVTWIWAAVFGGLGVLCFAPPLLRWLVGRSD